MFFIGLDVHQSRTSLCMLNENGKKVKECQILGGWDCLIDELSQIQGPFAVCFEASTGCGYLYDRITPLAVRVEVAHPGHLRLIYRCKKKNDRVDAFKLAKLLYQDMVPKAYIPKPQVRAWRSLLEFRHQAVGKRTRVKNELRSLLRGCGIGKLLPRKGLWARRGVQVLREIQLPNPLDALRRDMLLDQLALCQLQVNRLEGQLDQQSTDNAQVALLQTIPGVGPRTAEAVMAYIDDAKRFGRGKQVAAYFGLVPCQDASAERNHLGHITGQGPATVRGLLVEAGWQAIRHSPTIRAFYQRLHQDKKERRKIALVAVAHHLVLVMYAMLREGQAWRENPRFPVEPAMKGKIKKGKAA